VAVLIDHFSIVLRLEAIDARYPGGWEAFCAERVDERSCWDERILRLAARDRHELRELLAALGERLLSPEQEEERRDAQCAAGELALVYALQTRRVPWLAVMSGRLPDGGPEVAGCYLADAPPGELALPAGWSVEQAVDPLDEPADGDEWRPTWHEYLAEVEQPGVRAEMLAQGPGPLLAWARATGRPKPFAGQIRPGGKLIEQEAWTTDEQGRRVRVVQRWIKL
jgi:hypothetical protein